MADINISSLPLLSTASGSDYLQINSSGVDYKIAVNNLINTDNRLQNLENAIWLL